MAKEVPFQQKVATLANITLALGGLNSFFVFVYFLYHYALTGDRQLTSSSGALFYYGVPAVVTVLLFAALLLPPAQKINFALLAVSMATCLYALETLIATWSNLPSVIDGQNYRLRIASAKAQGIEFDTRPWRDVIRDMRAEGIDATADVFPGAFMEKGENGASIFTLRARGVEFAPIAGVSNKTILFCNETGKWLTYQSDVHGFNNSNALWHKSPLEVAAVGDSYVEGMCVAEEDNFTALIRKRYPATLNLGKQSAGPLLDLAAIKEYAQIVKPKVVLWFFYENDIWRDLMAERMTPLLLRYLEPDFNQDLFHRQPEIDGVLTGYIDQDLKNSQVSHETSDVLKKFKEASELFTDEEYFWPLTRSILRLSELRQRLGLVHGTSKISPEEAAEVRAKVLETHRKQLDEMRPALDLFPKILVEAKRTVNEWGGKMYFIFLPSWDRYVPPEFGRPERDEVLRAARQAGIPIIDLHPAFAAQRDPLSLFPPFPVTSHYNERGHRLVAEEVLRAISLTD